jgi:hypothetical protein
MKTRLSLRWAIVVCLLAALPGLTAVMAQGQEPGVQTLAVTERGESPADFPWTNTEVEPNNTPAQARVANGIDGGTLAGSDVDYWVILGWADGFYGERDRYPVLIDIEAQSIGSTLDATMCLYSDDGFELTCNDNTDTADPMLYYNLESEPLGENRLYYLAVRRVSGSGRYQLLVSSPLLISAAAANLGTGYVDGIPFQAGDILAYSKWNFPSYDKWTLFFDISDLGVKANLTNLAAGWRNSDGLLVGFPANVTLPGIGRKVTPWEIVLFNPTTVGPRTEGSFSLWWDGRSKGLTTTAEKIDAVDWPEWTGNTRLAVSTTGTASVSSGPGMTLKLQDEDVGLWRDDAVFPRWETLLNPSTIPGWPGEDVVAYSYVWADGDDFWVDGLYRVVIQGTASCYGYFQGETETVTQKDIVELAQIIHSVEQQNCLRVWHGSDHGWNYNIDAIDWPLGWEP